MFKGKEAILATALLAFGAIEAQANCEAKFSIVAIRGVPFSDKAELTDLGVLEKGHCVEAEGATQHQGWKLVQVCKIPGSTQFPVDTKKWVPEKRTWAPGKEDTLDCNANCSIADCPK
jgi:hypothetical protein